MSEIAIKETKKKGHSAAALNESGFEFYTIDFTSEMTSSTEQMVNNSINSMISKRVDWEENEYLRSNQKLYAILAECYFLYQTMNQLGDEARVIRNAFDRVCNKNGHVFKASTQLMTRIVQCVFGIDDRRRISNYAVSLRIAAQQKTRVEDLVDFFNRFGGIEEVRRTKKQKNVNAQKNKPEQVARFTPVQQGRAATFGNVLSVVNDPVLSDMYLPAEGVTVLFLATAEVDGTFAIRRMIQDLSLINATYKNLAKSVTSSEIEQMFSADKANEDKDSTSNHEA